MVNSSLSTDVLGGLSSAQVKELYGPLNQFYQEVSAVLDACAKRSWINRTLMRRWTDTVTRETEKLGDIVEALAWGADDELREYLNTSAATIDLQLR